MEVGSGAECPRVFWHWNPVQWFAAPKKGVAWGGTMSDAALKQAILFFGIVSFFLGKKALEGDDDGSTVDPLVAGLQRAGVV